MRVATLSILVLLLLPLAAGAELVLFENGYRLQVEAYRVDGSKVILEVGGGTLTVPIGIIDTIEDEELVEALPGATEKKRPPTRLDFRGGDPVPTTPYGRLIHRTARSFRLNAALLAAIVQVESGFDDDAVGADGRLGLMQVLPATAAKFGIEAADLLQPETNLQAGVRYLNWLRKRYSNDLDLVLAAYHGNSAAVDRLGEVPPDPELQRYIRQVRELLDAGS